MKLNSFMSLGHIAVGTAQLYINHYIVAALLLDIENNFMQGQRCWDQMHLLHQEISVASRAQTTHAQFAFG